MAGQIIGDPSTAEFTGAAFNLTAPKQFEGGIHEAVLNSGQRLIEYGVLWMPTPSNGTSGNRSISVCLYDLDTDIPLAGTATAINYDTAALVAGNAAVHVKATLAVDISAHAGKRVGLGLAPPSAASNSGFKVGIRALVGPKRNNHSTSQATLPSPFVVTSSTADSSWGIYAVTEDIDPGPDPTPDPSLDGVSPDTATNDQSLTAVISEQVAPGDVDLVAGALVVEQPVTSWTYSAGTNKTTVVSAIAQGGLPFGTLTARYTSGGTVLSEDVLLQPIAGNIQVAISNGLTEPGYIFEQLESGNVANITHVEHTDSPNTVVSAQGAITQTIVRPFQARARDGSDNTWSAFATIITAAVAEPDGVAAQGALGAASISVIAVVRPAGVVGMAALGAVAVSAGGVAKPVGVAAVGRVGHVGSSQSAIATPLGVDGVVMMGVVTASGEVVSSVARPAGVRGIGRIGFFLRVSPPVTVGSFVIPDITVIGATAYIEKVEGDTRGINIQFVQNSKHLTLAGWSGFELVVDARKNPTDSSTRQFLTAGVVVDELKGRVYFPVSGDIPAGKYYFNARCVTPAGERFTFMRGNYQVVDSIP